MNARRVLLHVWAATLFAGCVGGGVRYVHNDRIPEHATTRHFDADLETTWQAVFRALESYPVAFSDPDQGVVYTDWIAGTSPVFYREEKVPRSDRPRPYVLGVQLLEIAIDTWAVFWVYEGGPAERAGIEPLDIVWECNGEPVFHADDVREATEDGSPVDLTLLRGDSVVAYTVQPAIMEVRVRRTPIETEYRLKVRVNAAEGGGTDVEVLNQEDADFALFFGAGPLGDMRRVPTATVRESYLLTLVGFELADLMETG